MKVLYADDDIQVRDYVSMLLEAGLDCEILEASSGNEALSILEFDSEIDFVITEVRMKGGNGNVIVDYLDEHSLNIPIVWLSEDENRDIMIVQEVLARSPLNAFVDKPFRDDQFFPVIDRILALKEEHAANGGSFDNDDDHEDVEFDDDDFDFGEDPDVSVDRETSSSRSSENPFKKAMEEDVDRSHGSSEDDWSYGFKKKGQGEGESLDYSLKKNKGAEVDAGYSLKKEFNHQEGDAGYSLKKEFNHQEGEAGYSLKKEFNHQEGDAGYSLKKEFNQGAEEELDFGLKKNNSEEELDLSKEKKSKSDLELDLSREKRSLDDEELSLDKQKKENKLGKKKTQEKDNTPNPEDDYDKERFKRIKIKRFLNFKEICCEVYIKINPKKYLKVINANEEYQREMIERYQGKGTQYLFIETKNYERFSEQFGDLVLNKLEKAQSMSDDIKAVAELAAFEHTLEFAKDFGITPITANKVKQSVKANLKSLQKMPKLEGLLSRIMRGGDYLSEHSLLLSCIAGQICMATSWGNAQALEKLSMAAMFHDVALEKNQWAKLHTLEQMKEAGLTDAEIEKVRAHPGLAAKMISEGEHIFADVDSIIMQHHEMPDKTGYPRGLGALTISPLSCIFIIASEFVEELYGKPASSIDMESIKAKFSDKFNKGNFKKPLEAFLKVF